MTYINHPKFTGRNVPIAEIAVQQARTRSLSVSAYREGSCRLELR